MQGWDCWINLLVTHFFKLLIIDESSFSVFCLNGKMEVLLISRGRVHTFTSLSSWPDLDKLIITALKSENCFTAFTSSIFHAYLAHASLMLA